MTPFQRTLEEFERVTERLVEHGFTANLYSVDQIETIAVALDIVDEDPRNGWTAFVAILQEADLDVRWGRVGAGEHHVRSSSRIVAKHAAHPMSARIERNGSVMSVLCDD